MGKIKRKLVCSRCGKAIRRKLHNYVMCRPCYRKYRRDWDKAHPDKVAKWHRDYWSRKAKETAASAVAAGG